MTLLCLLAGAGLIGYGISQIGATKRHPDPDLNLIADVPDDVKRTDGWLSIGLGCVLLLGAFLSV